MTHLSHLLGAGAYRGALVSLLLLLITFSVGMSETWGGVWLGGLGSNTSLRLQIKSDATSEDPPY